MHKLRKKVEEIISFIDLNYTLAEAKKYNYEIVLMKNKSTSTISPKETKKIVWSNNFQTLSYNYSSAELTLHKYIKKYYDRVIKLKISSKDYAYPLNRNIIIYVPYEVDLKKIKDSVTILT